MLTIGQSLEASGRRPAYPLDLEPTHPNGAGRDRTWAGREVRSASSTTKPHIRPRLVMRRRMSFSSAAGPGIVRLRRRVSSDPCHCP